MQAAPSQLLHEELAVVLGADTARALMAAFAGRQVYIPRVAGPHHPLTSVIGPAKAALLCEYWHGTRMDFPLAAAKRQQAIAMIRDGKKVGDIAGKLWITERHVRRLIAEAGDSEGQHQLFG